VGVGAGDPVDVAVGSVGIAVSVAGDGRVGAGVEGDGGVNVGRNNVGEGWETTPS